MRTPTKGHQVIAELAAAAAHHQKMREHAAAQARDHYGRFEKAAPQPPPQPLRPQP